MNVIDLHSVISNGSTLGVLVMVFVQSRPRRPANPSHRKCRKCRKCRRLDLGAAGLPSECASLLRLWPAITRRRHAHLVHLPSRISCASPATCSVLNSAIILKKATLCGGLYHSHRKDLASSIPSSSTISPTGFLWTKTRCG